MKTSDRIHTISPPCIILYAFCLNPGFPVTLSGILLELWNNEDLLPRITLLPPVKMHMDKSETLKGATDTRFRGELVWGCSLETLYIDINKSELRQVEKVTKRNWDALEVVKKLLVNEPWPSFYYQTVHDRNQRNACQRTIRHPTMLITRLWLTSRSKIGSLWLKRYTTRTHGIKE